MLMQRWLESMAARHAVSWHASYTLRIQAYLRASEHGEKSIWCSCLHMGIVVVAISECALKQCSTSKQSFNLVLTSDRIAEHAA